MVTGLAAFLTARLDEDEQRAREAMTPGVYRWVDIHDDLAWIVTQTDGDFAGALPKRWLAEVTAKRAILAAYAENDGDVALHLGSDVRKHGEWDGLRFAVRSLAAVYSDHPDYRAEWKP